MHSNINGENNVVSINETYKKKRKLNYLVNFDGFKHYRYNIYFNMKIIKNY